MIAVLGLGNVLMGDDGFGPAAIKAFEETYDAGPDVNVVDLGTPGLDLLPWLADLECAVVVDTVTIALPPGTVRVYGKEDVLRHAPAPRVSPHDPGLKQALMLLEFAGRAPRELTLVGVVPASTLMSVHLSPPLRDALPRTVEAIAAALRNFGAPPARRPTPAGPAEWWPARPPAA
jgi:hydrogenase maturation protease